MLAAGDLVINLSSHSVFNSSLLFSTYMFLIANPIENDE